MEERLGILAHLQALRDRRPRHVWSAAIVACLSLFGMVAAFGTAPDSAEIKDYQRTVIEPLALVTDEAATEEGIFVRAERIQRGDTVAALLSRLGVQDEAAFAWLRQQAATQALFRQLRPGKTVTAKTTEAGELLALTFPLNGSGDNVLQVERRDGRLQAAEQALSLAPQLVMKSGEIRTSLFAATDAIDMPDSIAIQMADLFSGDIDFHRDLRKGDMFSVVYELLLDEGRPARSGRILAAEFINNGKAYRAIWFAGKDGQGYYTSDGKNIRKAFLRSPLEFSRITSGFSSGRFHPILQTWRAHKGVDYGAPIGTRVKATGDGVVEFVGRQGGYGNLVVISHHGRFTTHYGHLNGFAAGIRKGGRVSQGDIIGYVGRTGWATGPHLHYEFRINNVHQNPLALNLPSAPPLAPAQLAAFQQFAAPLVHRLDRIQGLDLALID